MKALIFAAGKGTRMMPLTADTPKPLLKVLGKTLLEYNLEALPGAISEIVLVIGYKGEMIKDHLGNEWHGKKITYVEQGEPLGTWHALEACKPHVANEQKFLLLYADDLYAKKDLEALLGYSLAALVFEVEDPRRFGVYVVDSANKIIDSEEGPTDPKSNLVNMGAYVLSNEIFNYAPEISARGEYFLTDAIQKFIRDHAMYAQQASFWIPIGYPEDLKKAEEMLKDSNG